ncbi:MAG: energy transducer TonB [Steroidobacteraceae bacterium]
MYRYEEPSLFSGKRGLVFLLVIIFHIGLGYALVNGLGAKIVQVIIPPVEIAQIDKPKTDDKPPPPPPKIEEVKPFVPPPEVVDIQADLAPTNAITSTTSVKQAAPPPVAAPKAIAHTNIRMDPKHPLKIGEDYYPDASKRNGEEGTCRVQLKVAANGIIEEASIQQTSGFPRLDEACLKAVKGQRMLPATDDGKPVETVAVLPITWKLRSN